MAIFMQHSWDIRVTQKSAARDQRFFIAGAASGNGPHDGVVGAPVVSVQGNNWSITIQSKVGATWVNSTEQILFPTSAASGFTIRSDDAGANPDRDFNDLVLHCTPVATSGATDYFTFGNISCYEGICWRNPCFRGHIVIDSAVALAEALRYPALKDYLKKVYPDRLFEVPVRLPIPQPDPPPFTPIMLPLQGDSLLPQKEATLFRKSTIEKTVSKSKAAAEEVFTPIGSARLRNALTVNAPIIADRAKLAGILDKFRFVCNVEPMPFSILRFLEYDRTNAEMADGPYTGTGARQVLGYTFTDSFGNYVFRYQRSDFDDLNEVNVDRVEDENIFVQARPDLIVQLLDPFDTNIVLRESALHANVPTFKRVNMCFPCTRGPRPCNGQGIIQYIGDLLVVQGASGVRGGGGNILGSSGKISNASLLCAAWRGKLNLIACLANDAIKYYTVRYKRPLESAAGWRLVTEDSRLPWSDGVNPLPQLTSIRRSRSLQIDGVMTANVPCYENVENSADAHQWITTSNKKADLSTSIYVNDKLFSAQQGTIQFRIEGYDASGNKIATVDETIDLYLDNRGVEADIDPNVQLGSETLGNCALFTLPYTEVEGTKVVTDERVPITVRFRAKQDSGFMGQYIMTIAKGAVGNIALERVAPAAAVAHTTALPTAAGQTAVGRSYTDTVNLVSCAFTGTPDEPGTTGDYLELTVRPENNWLDADQNFCAFRIRVQGYLRHTNGENNNPDYHTNEVLIGIERPE